MRVGAFIVGAPRCGTYAWFSYLSRHPQVIASRRKEPNWFCTDLPGVWRVQSLDEYHALFPQHPSQERRLAIEASVLYLASRDAPAAIHRYNPDAKILIFLRPPLAFLRSYHGLLRWLLFEDQHEFSTAWALQPARAEGRAIPRHCLEPATLQYLAMAKFGEQVTRYRQHFPPEQISVITDASWVAAPRANYRRVLEFLELEDDGRTDFPIVNPAQAYRSDRLAEWQRYPRRWQESLGRAWQWLPGAGRLNLHRRLLQWNTQAASHSPLTEELEQQIRTFLAADQTLLQHLLPAVELEGATHDASACFDFSGEAPP